MGAKPNERSGPVTDTLGKAEGAYQVVPPRRSRRRGTPLW
jgi:hypothetical protein